ncbi:MAG TPA: AlpA family transcriptional regulator [Marinospirillum sp.]|uniref:helix-turn-helix transcriptional regulator n=1 Tax=Marinospirillum sp. TaxID=2183934 RepID=UPI002B4967BC|nr:AlpA family transcriptional regulator [Marinospirillum sp.]HKM16213.1 AlpA family transcriptional regulator [Marinospirillum sp.]
MKKYLKDDIDNAVRIMRMGEVVKKTGYSRSSIYALMAEGDFPKNVKLGLRAVGWSSHEVQAWVNEKLAGGA